VAHRGRAVAGVRVVTLHGLAAEILERCGEPLPAGASLLPVLLERLASRESALRVNLEPFQDGYTSLVGTARDLLDAGFEASHADAVDQLLAERGSGAETERARALVRAAAALAEELAAHDLGIGAHALQRATDLLRTDTEHALPARAVLVHGFADATGVATDLIETLLRQHSAWVYLDEPPDPADPSRADVGISFGEHFVSRLGGATEPERPEQAAPVPAAPEMFRAPGVTAEVREVARRVRRLLAAGVVAERIGVVARDLGPYAAALRVHFQRLGVPFSALAASGSRGAGGRRVAALAELMRLGGDTPTGTWFSAGGSRVAFDLRLAFHVCGAARLRDAAALDLDRRLDSEGGLALPVRRGLVTLPAEGDDAEGERTIAPRRRVSGAQIRRAVDRAASLVARLERWPATVPLATHLARTRPLLERDLGWTRETPGAAETAAALSRLSRELPGTFELSGEEYFALVRRELAEAGGAPLGGGGGGVQVLSVIEARGRTFGHLFLLGMNRDVFPRSVSEDPLLPDRVRLALASLLPDIPVKHTGFDEERFLFAELLSSAERVTISWLACDDDGKARPPSPLVERLRLRGGGEGPPLVGPALDWGEGSDAPQPAFEHAVRIGLNGSRQRFGEVLPVACAEAAQGEADPEEATLVAAARLAVLDEMDPDRRTAEGRTRAASLGPYFGFIGAVRTPDPRSGELPITVAEGLAGCPWQVFLRKILRLEPPPDAQAGAGLDVLSLGQAVHRVLEGIVREAAPGLPETLEAALASPPVVVPWPDPDALERILRDAATGTAREAGFALPGLERVLAEQVRPFLAVARRLAWPDGTAHVLGVEVAGTVDVADTAGVMRRLTFRADRLEESEAKLLLTDFKTGSPYSEGKREDTRRRKFLEKVGTGRALQGVAYAAAASGQPARGRYLFLRPDLDDEGRAFEVASDDTEFLEVFAAVARAVLEVWDVGAFFPRLEEPDRPKEPTRCSSCEVREACLRGDSGARRRLAIWAARRAREGGAASPAERALLSVWRLASTGGGGAAGEPEPE
jgi:hypothetical protein